MLCKCGNYRRNYVLHLSPALNGSSEIRRIDTIEICNGIIFDFYTGLPHMITGSKTMKGDLVRHTYMQHRHKAAFVFVSLVWGSLRLAPAVLAQNKAHD